MPRGTLEVVLLSAKAVENNDFLYGGSNPQRNQTFLFTVSDSASELNLKIMDKDNFSSDDFHGVATIPFEAVFAEGSLPETAYCVVKDQEYCGEVWVALTFNPETERGIEENYDGWKESEISQHDPMIYPRILSHNYWKRNNAGAAQSPWPYTSTRWSRKLGFHHSYLLCLANLNKLMYSCIQTDSSKIKSHFPSTFTLFI